MIEMSAHGKNEEGYILLDILVALLIASIGFGSVFAAVSTAVRSVSRRQEVYLLAVEARNEKENEFERQISF